jgi:hypothetical protein
MPVSRTRVGLLLVVAALTATTAAEAAHLALAWTDTSVNEFGFIVERRSSTQATFEAVATLPADTTAYLDQNLPAGSSYCYRVSAYNGAGTSGYTNDACGTAYASSSPLSVSLNQSTLSASATMVAVVNVVGGVVPSAIDAYVVLDAGGGAVFSLQADGSVVPGLLPIARGIVLATASVPFVFPLAGAPPGNYVWMTAITTPGTLSLVSPVTSTPFTVVP